MVELVWLRTTAFSTVLNTLFKKQTPKTPKLRCMYVCNLDVGLGFI